MFDLIKIAFEAPIYHSIADFKELVFQCLFVVWTKFNDPFYGGREHYNKKGLSERLSNITNGERHVSQQLIMDAIL